ncbi:GNAT family N-acetyltransferase [Micromonospora sp. NPDC049559]|uniref:GNAT family N-acetyltransferase n=1 Tax=Micromonospora sp. NPDC049559 TaxID=3155923 RepID=UPI0034185C6C
MDILIRRAVPADHPAIAEITVEVYRELLPPGGEDYLRTLGDVPARAEHAELLVAADTGSGNVVGAVAFAPFGNPYAQITGPGEAEFRMLAVAPAAQRRGVAEALVRACLDRTRELGLHRVALVTQQNMLTAQRLYARLGFVRAPERDFSPVPGVLLWAFTVELDEVA